MLVGLAAGWPSDCGAPLPLSPRVTVLMFALALASVFVTPYAYLAYDIASVEHRALLTWAMRFGGGVAIVPVGLAVVFGLRARAAGAHAVRPAAARRAARRRCCCSPPAELIGIFIAGSNVRIPAHYHGCIVGVTLALMGLVYQLLPRSATARQRGGWRRCSLAVCGVGQLMHIVGLVWSGGYGVQRKVAGAEQVLRSTGGVAGMGLMGLGGAVAIVGGLVFVVVVLRRARRQAVRRLRAAR